MKSNVPSTAPTNSLFRKCQTACSTKNPLAGVFSGFTLVELLVVVAIVSILASLLLAAISQSKRKSHQIQCVGNLHQLSIGIQNFVTDNHAYPSAYAGKGTDNSGMWIDQIERGGFGITKPKKAFFAEGVWRCPAAQFPGWGTNGIPVSYGYNTFGVLPIGNVAPSLGLQGNYISTSVVYSPIADGEVVNPSEMMAIGESSSGGIDFMRISLAYPPKRDLVFSRHQGKVNVLFCDGHVESPKMEYVFEDKSDGALVRWNRDHQPHRDSL